MAPILIDNRGIIKLGFFAMVVISVVFSSGFLLGYQKAENHQIASTETEHLPLPEKSAGFSSDIEQQKPEVVHAGEIIDVDQPELVKAPENVLKNQTQLTKITGIKISDSKVSSSAVDDQTVLINKSKVIILQQKIESDAILIIKEDRDKAKYSIQVGMYGRLLNADIMVEKLQSQNLNAYVSDYMNKKDEVRYNVRIGYYVNKKSAMSALEEYRKNQKGDGYLVNYSVDSLIHTVAENKMIKQDDKVALVTEHEQISMVTVQDVDVNRVNTKNVTNQNIAAKDVVTKDIATKNLLTQKIVAKDSIIQDASTKEDAIGSPNILTKTQTENPEIDLVIEAEKVIYN